MAGELIWSRAALDDIEAIAAFIARDSKSHACRLVERLFQGGERLIAPDTAERLGADPARAVAREHWVQGFRLLYERQGEDVHVLAVIPNHHPSQT